MFITFYVTFFKGIKNDKRIKCFFKGIEYVKIIYAKGKKNEIWILYLSCNSVVANFSVCLQHLS